MKITRELEKVLEVKNLRISFKTNTGTVKAVRGIDFNLYKGRTLAIVGESGSGKSVTSKAILGILANNKIIEDGQIIFEGKDLLRLEEDKFTQIRGKKISMIFQDPLSALNPIMKVGEQLTEAMFLKSQASTKESKNLLNNYHNVFKKYATNEELKPLLTLVASMNKSENLQSFIEDSKSTLEPYKTIFYNALNGELEIFKANLSSLLSAMNFYRNENFLDASSFNVDNAEKSFAKLVNLFKNAKFTFEFKPDDIIEVFPVVFKQYLNSYKDAIKLVANREELLSSNEVEDIFDLSPAIRAGEREVIVTPEEIFEDMNESVKKLLARIQEVLNDSNLNASSLIDQFVSFYAEHIVTANKSMTQAEAKARALELLKEVGINEPERRYEQYPFEFSGGMRQRIVIAIALSSNPDVLICDEPTTALDVTIQAQILELINKLKAEKNLSIIFITHDLGVVANMADDIAVMYAGKIVEYGTVYDIFYDPRHPYTWALLGSMPDLDTKGKLDAIPGTPPNMLLPPKGDAFADRNKYALNIDYEERPPFYQVSETHAAATWLLDERAPDVEAPSIVVERIHNSLLNNPVNVPTYTNAKNSILKGLKLKKGRK